MPEAQFRLRADSHRKMDQRHPTGKHGRQDVPCHLEQDKMGWLWKGRPAAQPLSPCEYVCAYEMFD